MIHIEYIPRKYNYFIFSDFNQLNEQFLRIKYHIYEDQKNHLIAALIKDCEKVFETQPGIGFFYCEDTEIDAYNTIKGKFIKEEFSKITKNFLEENDGKFLIIETKSIEWEKIVLDDCDDFNSASSDDFDESGFLKSFTYQNSKGEQLNETLSFDWNGKDIAYLDLECYKIEDGQLIPIEKILSSHYTKVFSNDKEVEEELLLMVWANEAMQKYNEGNKEFESSVCQQKNYHQCIEFGGDELLSKYLLPEAIETLAKNPYLTPHHAKLCFVRGHKLHSNKENEEKIRDIGFNIHENLFGNPAFPEVRKEVVDGKDIYVHFIENVKYTRWLKPIAKNINCPQEILEKIILEIEMGGNTKGVVEAAIKNENFNPKLEFVNQYIYTGDISKIQKGLEILEYKDFDEKSSQEFTLNVEGDGGEFTQGLIENSLFQKIEAISKEKGISVGALWQEATFPSANDNYDSLELKDYYEYNELGHIHGPDLSKIKIKMYMEDGKEVDNLYDILTELDRIESVSSKNGRLVQFSDLGKSIVTGLTDERGFSFTQSFKVNGLFNWKKLKLKTFETDEVGLGEDYGDYLTGFSYEGIDYDDFKYEPKGKSFNAFLNNVNPEKLDNLGIDLDFNSDKFIELLKNNPEEMFSIFMKHIVWEDYESLNTVQKLYESVKNSLQDDTLLKLISDSKSGGYPASRFRKKLALNPKLSETLIQVLIKDDFRWVREASAMNAKITDEDMTNKISSVDRYTLKGYLLNPNCSDENKSKIRDLIEDENKYPIETDLYKLGFNCNVYPSEEVMGTVSIKQLADCIIDYEGIWSDYVWDNDWYDFNDIKHTYGMSDTATDVEYPDGEIIPIAIKSDGIDDDEYFDIYKHKGFVCSGTSYEKGYGWNDWKHYEAELEYELNPECITPTFDYDICDGYEYDSENLDGSVESTFFEDNGSYSTTGKGSDFDVNVDIEEMMSEMEESGVDVTEADQVISWLENSIKDDEKKK